MSESWRSVWEAFRARMARKWNSARPTEKQLIGARGEATAARFLQQEIGFRLLERNWRHGRYEIDLIGWDREVLVFVEVRSRHRDNPVGGFASVNQKKRRTLRSAVKTYLNLQHTRAPHFRFDIVEIGHASSGKDEVSHFPGVQLFHRHFS